MPGDDTTSAPSLGTTTRVEMTRRTISPYDLTAGDNPGTIISRPLLRGSNYDEWAANLRLALRARKKFGFADGSIQQPPENSEDYEDWCANNALVVSWIKITIDESLSSTISHSDSAFNLWTQIQKRFAVKNGQRVQRLKAELANCRQQGSAIEAYYGKLTKLWTSLADYQQGKTLEEIAREREEDKLHQFLMGLDDSLYASVKSNLLSRTPLPSVDEAYNVVVQDEESKALARMYEERNNGVSFAVQTVTRSNQTVCLLCGKSGHLSENCFKKIGYPPWWPDRNRSKFTKESRVSFNQGATSMQNVVSKKNVDVARANHVRTTQNHTHMGVANHSGFITEADRVGLTGLNDQQWKTLVHMLNERNTNTTEKHSGTFFFESWIIDTGASNHMTGSLDFLSDIRSMAPVYIKLPDGRLTVATKHGTVYLGSSLSLKNVLFVDGLYCHLISVSQLTRERGCVFQITDRICVVQERTTQMLIGLGEQKNGLYFFRGIEEASVIQTSSTPSFDIWHRRLGHASSKAIKMLKISDLNSNSCFNNEACDVCIRAKQTRVPFSLSENKTSMVFELVHCDLWGPYRTPALCGAHYFLTILDDYSRALWIYLLPSKQSVPKELKNFIALVERQFTRQVKAIRSDNGTEFICLSDYFQQKGIIHETSCVGTPQQNGRVERKHQHILNVARALRFQANLPIEFWGYCALTAGYLINRTPTPILKGKSPFEVLYNSPPPLNHLRTFGCLCYAHNQKRNGDKFATRSKRGVFIGYPHGKKGWRIYDLDTSSVLVSRDIIFVEEEFPFKLSVDSPSLSNDEQNQNQIFVDEDSYIPAVTCVDDVISSPIHHDTPEENLIQEELQLPSSEELPDQPTNAGNSSTPAMASGSDSVEQQAPDNTTPKTESRDSPS